MWQGEVSVQWGIRLVQLWIQFRVNNIHSLSSFQKAEKPALYALFKCLFYFYNNFLNRTTFSVLISKSS